MHQLSPEVVAAYWQELDEIASHEKLAVGTELKILGGLLNRAGFTRRGAQMQNLGKTGPKRFVNWMMSEPKWMPKALKGKSLPGFQRARPAVRRALEVGANEGPLGLVMAAPTTPAGPMSYLAARGALGRAAGVEGAGLPHDSVPGASWLKKLIKGKKGKKAPGSS